MNPSRVVGSGVRCAIGDEDEAKMYFGAKQLRVEDGPLVRGPGRFVADIEPEGTHHVAFVR